jgi:hypothetical protein
LAERPGHYVKVLFDNRNTVGSIHTTPMAAMMVIDHEYLVMIAHRDRDVL